MRSLIHLIVIVGLLLFVIRYSGILTVNKSPGNTGVSQADRVRTDLNNSLDQYQQNLDAAMQQSGASE
jgi:hypothetical protein